MQPTIDKPALAHLRERLLDSRYPRLLRSGPWVIATNGWSAALVREEGEAEPCDAGIAEVLIIGTRDDFVARLRDLREWAGEPGRWSVLPCPNWARHSRFASTEDPHDYDDAECYYGCTYVAGLGFAYEDTTRTYGEDWGIVAGVTLDCSLLADLLAPWPEGPVWLWVDRGALHVVASDDSWRVVLMCGDPKRVNVGARGEFTSCGARMLCGGFCCLTRGHSGEHECIGDTRGEPGSCPA